MADTPVPVRTPLFDGAPALSKAWIDFFRSLEANLRQTPQRLIDGALLTTVPVAYYASAANPPTRSQVEKLTFANISADPATVTVFLVPSGGAANGSNLLAVRELAAGETWECSAAVGHVLGPGGALWAYSGVDAAVNIIGSGILVSN